MKYRGKLIGEFEETQDVEADSIEEAEKMIGDNLGETIERTLTRLIEVEMEEVEEEK